MNTGFVTGAKNAEAAIAGIRHAITPRPFLALSSHMRSRPLGIDPQLLAEYRAGRVRRLLGQAERLYTPIAQMNALIPIHETSLPRTHPDGLDLTLFHNERARG